jgi:hypothetical protein
MLVGLRDHHGCLRVILCRREPEQRLRAEKVQARDYLGEPLFVLERIDAI